MHRSYFRRIFPGKSSEAPARALYERVILQSRQEPFYTMLGVPDTTDGRFELLLLHLALLMRRLRQEGDAGADLRQTLFDTLIFDLDQSLRESGVGDLKVGPKLKVMGESYYGRSKAYDDGLNKLDNSDLEEALIRNLFGTVAKPSQAAVAAIADYMRQVLRTLNGQNGSDLMAGKVEFLEVLPIINSYVSKIETDTASIHGES